MIYKMSKNTFPRTIGILGGGQLARMLAVAAANLGCSVLVMDKYPECPASKVAATFYTGDCNSLTDILNFAQHCDILAIENEFIDSRVIAELEAKGVDIYPSSKCLSFTQDKLIQKQILKDNHLPVPHFAAVSCAADVVKFADQYGWPLVLKKRRNGYDGKGNYTLRNVSDIQTGWDTLSGNKVELLVEEYWKYDKEIATIVTRGIDGKTVVYPVVETIQQNHICDCVKAPAHLPLDVINKAKDIAERSIQIVEGIGSFGVEMFLSFHGDIVINELAPRVHNSGHYTIDACFTSQFENHLRAILGLPLGNSNMIVPAAVMVNILGKADTNGDIDGIDELLRIDNLKLHLYSKEMTTKGRKMGHLTVLGDHIDDIYIKAKIAASCIKFGN